MKEIPTSLAMLWLAASVAFGLAVPVAMFYAFQMAILILVTSLGWTA